MKKFFKFALLFISVAVLSGAMVSCNDDDEPNEPFHPDMTKSAMFTYKLNVSQDMLDVANITLSWIDSDGSRQSEPMTELYWQKEITMAGTQATSTLTVNYELKDGVEYKDEPYTMMTSFYAEGSVIGVPTANPNADYKTLATRNFNFQNSLGIKAKDLEKYIARQGFTITVHVSDDFIDIHKELLRDVEESDNEEAK